MESFLELHFLSRLVMMVIFMYLLSRGRPLKWQEALFWVGVWVTTSLVLYLIFPHKEVCI